MNSFDLLRLAAAIAVIYDHVAPLSGRPVQRLFSTSAAELGVGVFFVISGYLVAASWRRAPDLRRFLGKRLLRIEPALIVSLAVTALVLGAFATSLPLADYLRTPAVWLYVVRNALLYPVTYALPGVFAHNPLPDQVNGALWTLRLEFTCYLGLAALGLAGLLTRRVVAGLAGAAAAVFGVLHVLRPDLAAEGPLRLAGIAAMFGFLFLAGAFLNLRDKPVPAWAAIASAPLILTPLWILGLPAVVVAVGSLRSVRLPGDISYGLYIYAFPLQQILAGAGHLSFAASLAVTAPFAIASWLLVEKPALRLKPGAARQRTATTSTSAPLTVATSPTALPSSERASGDT
ncbi:MAG: acyltransferase 3 [Phenylobacterium sp.]|nr:acyltransferase 3 [Phenylobacterium sp.]